MESGDATRGHAADHDGLPTHPPGHDAGAHGGREVNAMAAAATLHCLTGCAIGEILGLMVGTAVGLSNGTTIALSIVLAFVFGFSLSALPLLKSGLEVGATLRIVVAADTLSIATMELVDNVVMATIPGAMSAGLVNAAFWIAMMVSLTAAFAAAYPVNRWLLQRGKGHALTHGHHATSGAATGWRGMLPSIATTTLAAVLVAFMAGGLVVSLADSWGGQGASAARVLVDGAQVQ